MLLVFYENYIKISNLIKKITINFQLILINPVKIYIFLEFLFFKKNITNKSSIKFL